MTAQIFDLAAERAKRTECPAQSPSSPPKWRISQRGNPYTALDGYHVVVYKRGPSWAFRIECTEQEWYSERDYQTEDTARSDALLAVRQLGRSPRQA